MMAQFKDEPRKIPEANANGAWLCLEGCLSLSAAGICVITAAQPAFEASVKTHLIDSVDGYASCADDMRDCLAECKANFCSGLNRIEILFPVFLDFLAALACVKADCNRSSNGCIVRE
jgi:hypothetical protein